MAREAMPGIHFARIDCIKGGSLRDIRNHARGFYIQVFILVIHTSHRSFDEFKGNSKDRSRRKISVLIQARARGLEKEEDRNMERMKYTTRKGSPLEDSQPESLLKKTRIENETRVVARIYQSTVP